MILVKLFKMTLVMLLGELRKLGILLLQLFGMLVISLVETPDTLNFIHEILVI